MPVSEMEIYGIAHMIRDYARDYGRPVVAIADIEEYLFSMGMSLTEQQLYDTLSEMADADWLTDIDYQSCTIRFNHNSFRSAA